MSCITSALRAIVVILAMVALGHIAVAQPGTFQGKTATEWQKQLDSPHVKEQQEAAVALGNIGGEAGAPAVPMLKDMLAKGDLESRRKAAAVIGNIGKPALSAVPLLRAALKDSDALVRHFATASLGGIGNSMNPVLPPNKGMPPDPDRKQITDAVPDLVELIRNHKENNNVRMAAAVAIKEIGPCAELDSPKAAETLIGVLAEKMNSAKLRARVLWPLRLHSQVEKLDKLWQTLEQIVAQESGKDSKDLRYDAAQLLCRHKKKDASDRTLDTILEFLKDDNVFIAAQTVGGPGGIEIGKKKDGRIIALQALSSVINEKFGGDKNKLANRPDILKQVKILRDDVMGDPDVKKIADNILYYMEPCCARECAACGLAEGAALPSRKRRYPPH